MKRIIDLLSIIFFTGIIIFSACKKEHSCEACDSINKSPIAVAGPDQAITLPTDSILLDGSASSDPDGTITAFLWTKTRGPVSFNISNTSSAKTSVKNLGPGVYEFELKVTDNKGLIASDTMKVIVNDPSQPNRPPVANAGPDQTITLSVNVVTLDGSNSSDPDNNIISYAWTKISGPSNTIVNPNIASTQVNNLSQGIYQFELKVTDAGGLTAKDTTQITVNLSPPTQPCNNRSVINARLIPIGTLSTARYGPATGTAGSKILFAGGWEPGVHSSRVDIYDTITNTWSTAELSIAQRDGMAVATVGNKIFFAGGGDNDWTDVTSRVDIYDAATNSWSTAELSKARKYLAAVTAGNKIYFAGGGTWEQPIYKGTNVVDIYDNSNNTWSTTTLSEGRFELSATVAGNKIFFAGGLYDIYSGSKTIDIFNLQTNTWSTSQLQEVKASHSAAVVGNKIFWASGANTSYWYGYNKSNKVEIRDITTGVSTFDCITPKAQFRDVQKDDNIIFFTPWIDSPGDKFDIYNITTNTWSIGVLPVSINGAAIISVNNTIYVAGGTVSGSYSNQVWKLEF